MRGNEESAFIIDDSNPENDLVRGKKKEILEWKNRNKSHRNMEAIHPSSELIEAGYGHALSFDKNLYRIYDLFIMAVIDGYGYTCITFKVDGEDEQALITSYKDKDMLKTTHEISVNHQEIIFRGYTNDKFIQHTVQHNCREWTTLFIDYAHNSQESIEYTYILNNDPKMQGSFTLQRPKFITNDFTVGGRKDGTHFLSGAIHAIEIYQNRIPKPIPESLKQTIVKSQMIRLV